MSNERVDVLAVLEKAARESVPLAFALEVDNARTAVAELIEADKAYDEACAAEAMAHVNQHSKADRDAATNAMHEAADRRRAALSRIGGKDDRTP